MTEPGQIRSIVTQGSLHDATIERHEHARGLGGGHRVLHRDRLRRRAVPAAAQLAIVAHR